MFAQPAMKPESGNDNKTMNTVLQKNTRPQVAESVMAYHRIMAVNSYEEATREILAQNDAAAIHAWNFADSLFLMGAAVAKAQTYSSYGDGYFEEVQREIGVPSGALRRALGLYRTFGGSMKAYVEWKMSWLNQYDRLLVADIDNLIDHNRERQDISLHVDRYNRSLAEIRQYYKERGRAVPAKYQGNMSMENVARTPPLSSSSREVRTQKTDRKAAIRRRMAHALNALLKREDETEVQLADVVLPDGTLATITIELRRQ